MVVKRLRELLIGLAILPAIAQPVLAHSIWIVTGETQGEYDVVYGHPERNETEPYDPIKFQEARAYAGNGMPLPLSVKREKDGVTVVAERGVAAITASHNNGYFISVGENEFRNVFRPEALESNNEETEISHTYKYAKAFYEPSPLVSQRFGLPLEIIPRQNPYAVDPGETLQIQVLFQGKPQSGVTVVYGEEELKTNNNGIAVITLGNEEVPVIEAEYSIPSTDDEAADEIGYASTLTIDKARSSFTRR